MKTQREDHQPPRWANQLLRTFCAPHLLEEVQGDLQEEFEFRIQRDGLRKARWDYVRNVIEYIKPFAIRRKPSPNSNPFLSMNMLRHYGIVAVRNLFRHKAFSAINIFGLSLGMTCCLFIFLWVRDEKRVDNFHANDETLYSLYHHTTYNGGGEDFGYRLPYAFVDNKEKVIADEIKQVVPEIKYASPYCTTYELPWGYPRTFQIGDKIHKLPGSAAGEDFFRMFSYELIAGDRVTTLNDISSLAISRKMSNMFFKTPDDAIGKSIRYENNIDFTITAVFEDVPAESSLKFDFIINWKRVLTGYIERSDNKWPTFIQLHENADLTAATDKINGLFESWLGKNAGQKIVMKLQPFGDQYLVSNFVNGKPEGGRIEYVKIFSGVAVFILIIACINFMNLATARSVKRAREVGVRKVVGSSRINLIAQFFGESMFLALLAMIGGLILVQLFLPVFNNFTGKQIASPLTDSGSWIFLSALVLFTGVVAGSYPALFLSSLKPVRILKGVLRFTPASLWIRKGLAGFQFVLSIILLIVTLVVSRQTNFVQKTNLGYNRENLIYLRIEGELNPKYAVFKERALKMPGIAMVDRSSEAPHAMNFVIAGPFVWEGQKKEENVAMKPLSVGFDFLKIMDLKIVEGRDFMKTPLDSADAFMVNEEAVRQMGLKDPVGKSISAWQKKGHIIAVLKDYHTHSLHEPIKPLIMDVKEYEYFGVIIIRTEPGKTTEALASLEKVCRELNPNYPFDYQFVDKEYEKLYKNEMVVAKLTNAFAGIAIAISCLGLLGLIMFSAEQRTKEIGIRKVLGATVSNIIGLLSKDFIKLVVISFVIAAPVAGYFMNKWLDGFAFKTDLSWWIFAVAGISALLVALLTISVQAISAALANPVKSLKTE